MTIDTVEEQPQDIFDASGDIRFNNYETHASYLADILSDRYNTEWLEWEPETLWQTIKQDFYTDIHPINREKINAAKTVLLVDDFWMEWNVFEKVTKAINNQIPSFVMLEGCAPEEMSWCIEDSSRIRINSFNDEVSLYVRANCLNAGYTLFPSQLNFAQGELTQFDRELLAQWNSHIDDMDFPVEEDAVGVQLARLNSVRHYVTMMEEKGQAVKVAYGDVDAD